MICRRDHAVAQCREWQAEFGNAREIRAAITCIGCGVVFAAAAGPPVECPPLLLPIVSPFCAPGAGRKGACAPPANASAMKPELGNSALAMRRRFRRRKRLEQLANWTYHGDFPPNPEEWLVGLLRM